jgi:CRISPR/Cas system-associated protein Cas10 (large subunit of type III CRISPR-Cas system)
MSENIGVIDWFTKNRSNVEYPKESDELLDRLIGEIIQIFDKSSKLSKIADGLFETYQKNDLLNNISSDSRLPVCSLFHHLKNTSGIAVCLSLQNIEKKPDFISKSLAEYGVNAEYMKQDFISLVRIAALLHDIGKPRSYSASRTGQPFYYHTKQTEEIIESILSKANSELVTRFELKKILPLLASRHHSRDAETAFERMLSLADTVASAADRTYEVDYELNDGKIKATSKDRIFPHEINFDAGDLKCLETPHTEILGKSITVRKNIQMRNEEQSVQVFKDSTVQGGPIEYLGNKGKIPGNIGVFSLDIMGIQGFINEADELKMLRGGSYIVDDVLECVKEIISEEVCKEAVLFAGGGNLLSFIPDNEALMEKLGGKVKQEIKDISREGLQAAVVCFSEPLSNIAGSFDDVLEKSQNLLEVKKNETYSREIHTEPEKICVHCFKRPARSGGICEVCQKKEGTGRKQRSQTSKKFIHNTYGLSLPTQVSQVGDSIAVLTIDGNMMGRMFQQTTTPAEYTYKSEIFDYKFETILKNTIQGFLEDEGKRKLVMQKEEGRDYLGIDVLYAGGDDVLIIMNARGAIQFSQMLVNNIAESFAFEKKFHNGAMFKNNIVTVSCGIAIADYKFPIYFLLEAARDMESKAKRAFRERAQTNEFGIIQIPKGSIAVTAISSAMPGNDYSCFVLENTSDKPDVENLDKLNHIIDFELTDKDRAMVSDIITCGESNQEKLNLVKFMYSSLSRKKDRVEIEDCEWMADILLNAEVLDAAKMIIPHLRQEAGEVRE